MKSSKAVHIPRIALRSLRILELFTLISESMEPLAWMRLRKIRQMSSLLFAECLPLMSRRGRALSDLRNTLMPSTTVLSLRRSTEGTILGLERMSRRPPSVSLLRSVELQRRSRLIPMSAVATSRCAGVKMASRDSTSCRRRYFSRGKTWSRCWPGHSRWQRF